MKYFKRLEGKHIYISPMNSEDATKYVEWLNNPNIVKYLSTHNGLVSLTGEKEYLEEASKKEFNYSIVKKENDELLGSIALDLIDYKNGRAELGIFIGNESNLGKGYGTEAIKLLIDFAFKELRLHSIYLRTLDINERAQKSYQKCGFREIGRFHESLFTDGEYHDMVLMEIINKK